MAVILNQPVTTSTPSVGTLYDQATWIDGGAGASYIRLTTAALNQDGEYENTGSLTSYFDTTFDIWAGGGTGSDANYFYWGCSSTPENEDANGGGYVVAYDEFSDAIQLKFQGSSLTSVAQTGIDDSNWHTCRVIVNGLNIKVYFDGTLKINYTDSTRTLGGTLYGWGARTGAGANNEHRIRNLLVTSRGITLTGTATSSINESDIVTGGKTIILTTDIDEWTPTTAYTADLTMGGTASASGENAPNETAVKAFDDSSGTKWLVFATTGWIQYQFASSATHVIIKYAITSANDEDSRDPKDWTLQGSNDGSSWTTVDTVTGETFASRGLRKEFTCDAPGTTPYEYYRLDISANNGSANIIQMAELELYADAGFASVRQAIINGLDSAQAEANGWDAEVKANQGVAGVVRTSDTVVTITLDAQASYNITATETITSTVPASALTLGVQTVASPTFTVATGGVTTSVKDIIGMGIIPFAR